MIIRSYPAPVTDPAVILRITQLAGSGIAQQEVIWEMKRSGLELIPCIRLAQRIWNLEHAEAKQLVHDSDAWADMREANDRMHATAFEALDESGFEEAVRLLLLTAS